MENTSADDYFLEIESHFAARRKTPFILSAKDWVLMKKWRDDGIPLAIVIEAIDSVFEKNESSGRRKVISSLSYCRHAIKELWDERKELQAGEGGGVPEVAPAEALDHLAKDLEAAGVPAAAVEKVRALAAEKSVPRIEERLMEIERETIEEMVALLDAGEQEAIRREARAAIIGTSVDEKTLARTVEANLRRIARERFGLPRLTLFR